MKKKIQSLAFDEKGYIALISAIVILILLTSISFVLSFINYFNRFNVLDNEYKEISAGLAEACVGLAALKLAENKDYQGNEVKSIDGKNCQIFTVQSLGGNQYLIKTEAIFMRSYTNVEVKITRNAGSINVDYWREIP